MKFKIDENQFQSQHTNKQTNKNEIKIKRSLIIFSKIRTVYKNMFLCPFLNRSRLPEGDATKNRTSSSETIKFTLATSAGYPYSNTQSHHHQQYEQQQPPQILQSHNQNRYPNPNPNPNSSPDPIIYHPSSIRSHTKQTNNYNYDRDANKLKQLHDTDHSQTFTLTTGFRYNSNNNNHNVDKSNNNLKNANRTHTEYDTTKTYRQQSVLQPSNSQTSSKPHAYVNDQKRDEQEQQRKKYLDFIVSDIQPQSFQVQSTTTRGSNTKPLSSSEKELVNAFVNSQSSLFIQSTPESHVISTLPNKQTESQPISAIHVPSARLPANDTYRFVLTAGLSSEKPRNSRNRTIDADYDQSSDRYPHASHAESENIPLYVRKPQSPNSISTSNAITPLKHEIIVPTTYSPLRNWKIQYLKKPTLPGSEVFNTVVDAVAPDDFKKSIFGQSNRTKSEKSASHSQPPTSKTLLKYSYTFDGDKDYDRAVKTSNRQPTKFPSLEFRERLNRTFDTTTSKPLVSPYASLQTILEDVKPTQYRPSLGSYSITFGKHNVQSASTTTTTTTPKTTTKTKTTTTPRPPASSSSSSQSSNFFRSYYIITAPPKNKTQNHIESTPKNSSPVSYTPYSSSSSTTPISITTGFPSISSTERPFEWTPISSSVYPTNPVNNVQILPEYERFRPMRPNERPNERPIERPNERPLISITERPIISITTSVPQSSNFENYIQHSSHSNPSFDDFPPYRTTTPISITTSTPQISQFPPYNGNSNSNYNGNSHGIPPSGFSPIPPNPSRDREHYRKVVRMRSKKKLNNSSGGLTPVILNPSSVHELNEDDPELEPMRNNNFMKALESVSLTEQKMEHSTARQRGKTSKPTKSSKHPSVYVGGGNYEETLIRPSNGKNVQFVVNDDDTLVKYTVMMDGAPKYFSNYRHVKDDDDDQDESVNHHSLSDYIKDSTKYAIVKDEEEQKSKQHATLGDYVKEGSNYATEVTEVTEDTDNILSHLVDDNDAETDEPISSSTELLPDQREKFRATVEMPEFNVPTESEIKARIKQLEYDAEKDVESEYRYETTTNIARKMSTDIDLTNETQERNQIDYESPTTTIRNLTYVPLTMYDPMTSTTIRTNDNANVMTSTQTRLTSSTTQKSSSSTNSVNSIPPRASRVNPAIKTSIAGTPTRRMNAHTTPGLRIHQQTTPIIKCIDAKCNEIPSRYKFTLRNETKTKTKTKIAHKPTSLLKICINLSNRI